MRIAFIHPDLGIGGAERLILDAAIALQDLGHSVTIYTSYCNKSHAFEEVKEEKVRVIVAGDTIVPRNIGGRFSIVCAIARQVHLTLGLVKDRAQYDLYFVDQLSASIPIIRTLLRGRVLFYGHFPDRLTVEHKGLLKKLYRVPFDWIEEWTTSMADVTVVNSKFTKSVFEKNFAHFKLKNLSVVYPTVDIKDYEISLQSPTTQNYLKLLSPRKTLLSINRFERKKDVALAIKTFAAARDKNQDLTLLVIGGYDKRVTENVEYHEELEKLCDSLKLVHRTIQPGGSFDSGLGPEKVLFWLSCPKEFKTAALKHSEILMYTPINEHFGIVPLEAMLAGTPVLATNTGGPLETVVENKTGWCRAPENWPAALENALALTDGEREAMSVECKSWVASNFSLNKMAQELDASAKRALVAPRDFFAEFLDPMFLIFVVSVLFLGLAISLFALY